MNHWEKLVEQLKVLLPGCRVEVTRGPSPRRNPSLIRPPSGIIVYPPESKPVEYERAAWAKGTTLDKGPIYAVWSFIVGVDDDPRRDKKHKYFGWALFLGSDKGGNAQRGRYCMAKEVLETKPNRKNDGTPITKLDAAAIADQVRADLFV